MSCSEVIAQKAASSGGGCPWLKASLAEISADEFRTDDVGGHAWAAPSSEGNDPTDPMSGRLNVLTEQVDAIEMTGAKIEDMAGWMLPGPTTMPEQTLLPGQVLNSLRTVASQC